MAEPSSGGNTLAKGPVVRKVPEGDSRERLVCADCGFINYVNPKIVVGAVCAWQDKILLCRRAINPRKGYWTLPAGFLEESETTEAGAQREAWEEARARIELDGVLGVYSIPRLSQVQIIYRAKLLSPEIAAGPESLDVGLFLWNDIPWPDIAFPSVHWALDHFRQSRDRSHFPARGNPVAQTGHM
ncbi:MAG: NUDIX domain-containing protein [Alphaproteobacteria bacterium]|nr:NUDIX domain-containing protein [Alphaproteobacteria bacterium]